MKDNHIIEILEGKSFAELSASDRDVIKSHIGVCVSCHSAYEAAQLSSLILKERAQTLIEPTPFFQTRVMAAWREQQATENVPALLRLWNSSRALVSSMALTTAALGALSFVLPATQSQSYDDTVPAYTAESIIFDQGGDEPLSYEQVMSTIYSDEDEAK
jgi:hypothetical protein